MDERTKTGNIRRQQLLYSSLLSKIVAPSLILVLYDVGGQ